MLKKNKFFSRSDLADGHKQTAKKHLGMILRVGIAILACWWVARGMDFSKIGHIFLDSWLVLLEITLVFMFSQVCLALRWWLFMRAWDIRISCFSAIKLTFLGLYFNNFLPGSVGGDLVRAWYVAQYTSRKMASVISVFVDRVLALLGTLIIAIAAFIIAGQKGIFTRKEKSGIPNVLSGSWIYAFIALGLVVVLIAGIMVFPKGRKFLNSFFEKALHHGRNAVLQAAEAGWMLIRKPYLLPESLFLTFILQGMVVVSLWILGRQMGIPTELKMYFVFFPVMWVIGSIPISIAGIGIVEGGLIVLFMQFGMVPPELKSSVDALVLSQRAVWLIASLPGLVVYLSGKHLPKDIIEEFSVDEKKTIQ
jgi:glycosyltransferase 2 family protein